MYQKIPPTRRRNQFGPHYGFGVETNRSLLVAVIEQAGAPALRIAFTLAVIIFLFGGVLIFRRRHQLFDRDPNVKNDVPVVDTIAWNKSYLFWGGLTLVLLSILYQVWRA